MLQGNQLVGFGASQAGGGGTAYRYFRVELATLTGFPTAKRLVVLFDDTAITSEAMTNDSSPSPYVASAGSSSGGFNPFYAFDGSDSTNWAGGTSGADEYIQQDVGSGNEAVANKLILKINGTNAPGEITVKGSNNGTDFDTLYNESGLSWTSSEEKTFTW